MVVNSEVLMQGGESRFLETAPLVASDESPYFQPVNHQHPRLHMDQATLTISSKIQNYVTFAAQTDVCHRVRIYEANLFAI